MGTTVRTQRWPAILEPDVTLKAADRLLTSRPVLSAFADMVRRAGQTGGLRLLPFFFFFWRPREPADPVWCDIPSPVTAWASHTHLMHEGASYVPKCGRGVGWFKMLCRRASDSRPVLYHLSCHPNGEEEGKLAGHLRRNPRSP